MKNLNEKELKAIKKGLDFLDLSTDKEIIENLLNDGSITINTGRDDKTYAWIIYSETKEVAVEIETLEIISDESKIEELFC